MCSGSEAGSYLRSIDSCITQLTAQGPSRTCNESKEEEEEDLREPERARPLPARERRGLLQGLGFRVRGSGFMVYGSGFRV